DLLDLSHLLPGQTTVQAEPCDAAALARAALASVRSPAPGVALRVDTRALTIPFRTVPVLVLLILQSLLEGAAKFTLRRSINYRVASERPAEETLPFEDLRTAALVLFRVEDTGIGIAPADQKAIFDEFRQVDGSATRRFGGAGLGLALSQGLAHRLGGEIRLH